MAKITKICVEESFIIWDEQKNIGKNETAETTYRAKEAPMQSFTKAWDKIIKMIPNIMEVPAEWIESVKVKSLSISYTKNGTRSVQIGFDKTYTITEKSKAEKTPFIQFDLPAEGESEPRQCATKHATDFATVITEMEKYAKGERQQLLLPLKVEPASGSDIEI